VAPFLIGDVVKSVLGATSLVLWSTARKALGRR